MGSVISLKSEELREILAGMPGPGPENFPGRRAGAVLAVFTETERGPGLLFTKRAADLAEHAGQISFPGGAVEEGDQSLAAAAYRETEEEVGLAAEELEFLGPLPLQPVLQSWLIHPFAVWWPRPRALNYSPAEVEQVLIAPLAELMAQHQRECWLIPDPEKSCRYQIGEELLWGATARITGKILDRLNDCGYF